MPRTLSVPLARVRQSRGRSRIRRRIPTAGNNLDECRSILLRLFKWISKNKNLQITILSGDVHVGALGEILSKDPMFRRADSAQAKIHQVTSSAIGKLPPSGVAGWLINMATDGKFDLGSSFTGQLLSLHGVGRQILSRRSFAVLDPCDEDDMTFEDRVGTVRLGGPPGGEVNELPYAIVGNRLTVEWDEDTLNYERQ